MFLAVSRKNVLSKWNANLVGVKIFKEDLKIIRSNILLATMDSTGICYLALIKPGAQLKR